MYICTLKSHLQIEHPNEFQKIQEIFKSPNFNVVYKSLKTGNSGLNFINFNKNDDNNIIVEKEESHFEKNNDTNTFNKFRKRTKIFKTNVNSLLLIHWNRQRKRRLL